MKKIIFYFILFFGSILFFSNPAFPSYKLEKADLVRELQTAGYQVLGEVDYFSVPCLKIALPVGQCIQNVCRRVPSLNRLFFETREAIAVINGLNMFYPRSGQGRPWSTNRETILIPLDTTIQPKAFPEFNQKFSQYEKMIFVDREKQLLAHYEHGHLIACLPVSTGRVGKGTPIMEGWIGLRDKNHVSSIYDVLMPFSLRLAGPYFLHAGVMPGTPDSAGCIRLFTEHAKWLFERIGNSKTRFKVV